MYWKAGKEGEVANGRGHFLKKEGSKKPLDSNKTKEQRDARIRFLVAEQRGRQTGNGFKEQ